MTSYDTRSQESAGSLPAANAEQIEMPRVVPSQSEQDRFVYVMSTREAVESSVVVHGVSFELALHLGVPGEALQNATRFRAFFPGCDLASWDVAQEFAAQLAVRAGSEASYASQRGYQQLTRGFYWKNGIARLSPEFSQQDDSGGSPILCSVPVSNENPGFGALFIRPQKDGGRFENVRTARGR